MIKSTNKIIILTLMLAYFTSCDKQVNNENSNTNPAISITLEDENPAIGSTQTFTALVSDPDEDDLVTVSWSVSAGLLSNITGLEVQWTAPEDTQMVAVTATANDGNEGQASAKATLPVGNRSPEISGFTSSASYVLAGNTVTLTCSASDPENQELRYLFYVLPAAGTITHPDPQSNSAIWTVPLDITQSAKAYKLIVEVSDILNFTVSDTLEILVYFEYGSIWVVDSGFRTVTKYASNGEKILTAAAIFQKPIAVANNIDEFYGCYVADYDAGSIFKIDATGQTIATYNNIPNVIDIAVHQDTRTIWALSVGDNSLTILDGFTDAVIKKVYGFKQPRSITINQASDDIWITEPGNNRVIKLNAIDLPGNFPDTISVKNSVIFPDDSSETFYNAPYGLCVRNQSNATVYIADKNDNQIERLMWDGESYQRVTPPISLVPLKPKFVSISALANHGWIIFVMDIEGRTVLFPGDEVQNVKILAGDYVFEYPQALVTDEAVSEYWIGDNGTNQLVKIKINSDFTFSVLTKVNGFLSIKDIVLNK